MGCFAACFGTMKHKIAIKKCHCNTSPLQEQSFSPRHEIHEAIKLLAAATKSVKEEEIINPMKLNSESQFRNKSSNENDQTENKKEKGQEKSSDSISPSLNIPHPENREDEGFLICDKRCIGECCLVQQESSESLFSLSIDSRRQQVCAPEMGDKEVSSPLKISDKEAISRIVENEHHGQLKDKENINLEGKLIIPFSEEEPNIKGKYQSKCDNEVAVDTSLSSWLVETKKSSHKNSIDNSPESEKNYGDRRILGEISPQEHKQQLNEEFPSANSTPCGVDDQPGIGTVGSYWRQSRVRANLANGF